jgi:PadR family transcriptional regulator PadR
MTLIDLDENARKKGSAELLVLAQIEGTPRHAYEIGVEIERRSEGVVSFQTASLYPVLYRLERKGLIAGHWVEAAGQRRRMYYSLTPEGQSVLWEQRRNWSAFLIALQRAASPRFGGRYSNSLARFPGS